MDGRTERFGFTVERHREWDEDDPKLSAGWRVYLPHQCSTWDIAGEHFDGEPLADAVSELETFIAEAQQALNALREQRELREE